MAILKFEGQQVEIPDTMVGNDKALLEFVAGFSPELANGTISRTQEGGQIVITLVKQAGRKATSLNVPFNVSSPVSGESGHPFASLLELLAAAPSHLNPALPLAWELSHRESRQPLTLDEIMALQPAIEGAVAAGSTESESVTEILNALKAAVPVPANELFPGF
jgi:hypothetical protein